MKKTGLPLILFGLLVVLSLHTTSAYAQATRTWVSGVGDDVNPCSRTAPCKTFAGAISKTAANGEINCLDPGGFGGLTITKSITVNCHEVVGSVLVSGTPGITINAGTTGRVILRNLQIQGVGAGTIGVRILAAASVTIEDCVVTQFTQQGINDARTAGNTKLFIRNTIVRHNTGTGIALVATAPSNTVIENTSSIANLFGVAAGTGNNVMIKRSVFSGNTNTGIHADAGGQVTVDDSVASNNVIGIGAAGTIRLSNSDIAFNTTGVSGATTSFGNNRVSGNGAPGVTPTIVAQQ